MHMHAATIYDYSYKGMLSKSIPLAAHPLRNRVADYDIAIRKTSYNVYVVYTHFNDGTWPSILCSRWSLQEAERLSLSS